MLVVIAETTHNACMQTKFCTYTINSEIRNGIDIEAEVEWVWKDSFPYVKSVSWNKQGFTDAEIQTVEKEIEKKTTWMQGSVTRPEQDWDDIGD